MGSASHDHGGDARGDARSTEIIFNRPVPFSRAGFGRAGFGRAGFSRAGFGRAGFGRAGFSRAGFSRAGFGRAGFSRAGFGRAGFSRAGYHGRSRSTILAVRSSAGGIRDDRMNRDAFWNIIGAARWRAGSGMASLVHELRRV